MCNRIADPLRHKIRKGVRVRLLKNKGNIRKKTGPGIPKHCRCIGGLIVALVSLTTAGEPAWTTIDKGLSYAKFKVPAVSFPADSTITVIRIDPNRFALTLCSVSQFGGQNRTAREWVKEHGLAGAINAGMYLTDYKTSCGYMKNYSHFNNPRNNKTYHSVAAFNPVKGNSPPFKIFDDTDPGIIAGTYNSVIQNLRLVKRPRVNRWQQQERRWSEAALGEDRGGNILFIFSRIPFTMHDFNELLLRLPVGLVCAQHLEGGPEASLYINLNGMELCRTGSYSGDYSSENSDSLFRPVPNVIGVVKRQSASPIRKHGH